MGARDRLVTNCYDLLGSTMLANKLLEPLCILCTIPVGDANDLVFGIYGVLFKQTGKRFYGRGSAFDLLELTICPVSSPFSSGFICSNVPITAVIFEHLPVLRRCSRLSTVNI